MLARAKSQGVTDGNMAVSVASRIKDRSGRKKKHTPTEVKAELLLLHLIERTTLRSISEKTSIALATLHRYLKHGMYRAHSSAVATWFLSAVAQPRDLDDAGCWWDGKIGTWPFVKTEAALRSSVNRPAGTNETKTITVTKDVYRFFLVDNRFFLVKKVLPAIVAKWPPGNTTVKLQHDDARAHVTATDANLCAAFASYKCVGWSFSLAPQPSNSPDLNILDLGFFAAIQFIQHRKASRNIDDLVANVCHAFDEYPSARLERTFLTTGMYGFFTWQHVMPDGCVLLGQGATGSTDSVAMELAFAMEEREATDVMALSRRLEALIVEDDDDLNEALDDLGIEGISIDE
ncbi:Aste57867_5401 [Aphanomyces stellatus]|uniref:Aste57867_5401 protein n=1 Tax=Aphanomyces stellatus TaxID=120398 RepID=A0A485KEH7_9STRA|nr:hypothetical protein As57867_005388 [Aphanomyces stellatus]VFT82458.1 Aste57867_5401 [Aphanomyces stellatus]